MATVSPFEAECLVSSLKVLSLEAIGGSEWMRQHEVIEKLNIQCHESAQSKHDEFVVQEMVAQDKLPTMIHNLVTTEVWKEKVFPFIVDEINDSLSLKAYMVLFEEASLVSMLQILLYHSSSMEEDASSDEHDTALLELVDYVHRKLVAMVTKKVNVHHFDDHIVEEDVAKVSSSK